MPPPILYKYFSSKRVNLFPEVNVWFSNPTTFNDVFEISWPSHKVDVDIIWAFWLNIGVFCLTDSPDNHLMWVHYADSHKGFVVGFKTDTPQLNTEDDVFDQVRYEECPSEIEIPSKEVCLYKDQQWSYENEWRCIRSFDTSKDHYTINLGTEAIAEVIFGSKMLEEDIMKVLKALGKSVPEIEFYRSTICFERHKIKHEKFVCDLFMCLPPQQKVPNVSGER